MHLVQQEQFRGSPTEDPNLHISNFLQLCDTIKTNGASEDILGLYYFHFPLEIKPSAGYNSNHKEVYQHGMN